MRFVATGILFASLLAPAAWAGERAPTAEELPAIEKVLKDGGYTSWKAIEWDNDNWEVDDAVHTDGNKYYVTLSIPKLEVVNKYIDRD